MVFNWIHYYSMAEFQEAFSALPYRFPLVLVSTGAARRWNIEGLLLRLQSEQRLFWHAGIDSNPTQKTLAEARKAVSGRSLDGIVAIGGGSAMDLAKQVSALYGMPGLAECSDILQAVKEKSYLKNEKNALPILTVPTTAGTGSEATQWATFWDMESGKKYSVDAPWLCPEAVWIVPELTASLPARMTLSSGLDAVCQAVEAYWAKASNPFSKELSLQATRLMLDNMDPAIKEPQNLTLRRNLCTGSLLAGLSFSQTRTTACHSLSYPLTARFAIEHGFAAAMTLAPVADINRKAADIAEVETLFAPYGGIRKWIDTVCKPHITLRLSAFNIKEADIDFLVTEAFTGGRIDNNPAELTPDMVREILKTVL